MNFWYSEIRHVARYTTDLLFSDVIDSKLPDEEDSIPEYMIELYEDSIFSTEWLNTPEHVKRFMLDAELDQYMRN